MKSTPDEIFVRLIQNVVPESRLVRASVLEGGVSAQTTALEIELPDGASDRLVVRQYGAADLRQNPDLAADEFRLLQTARSAGLPVPEPLLFDQSNQILPGPYIVVEYVDGETEFTPENVAAFVQELAFSLAKIHTRDCATSDLSFLPRQTEIVTRMLNMPPATYDDSLDEECIRWILQTHWPVSETNWPCLLHGDFWPGNILWRDGELVAIIDWEDAALGDPLADLANGRLEILWAFGVDAMDEFTDCYRSTMSEINFTDLPVWDLYAALRPASKLSDWGLDAATEHRMRERHTHFVMRACEDLGL